MDFFAIIIVAVIACWVGWHARGIILLAKFGSDPDFFIKILQTYTPHPALLIHAAFVSLKPISFIMRLTSIENQ